MDLTTIAGIVAATMLVTENIKNLPFLTKIPTKIIACIIGAVLAGVALAAHLIVGNPIWIIVQVLIAVFGASGVYDVFKTKKGE